MTFIISSYIRNAALYIFLNLNFYVNFDFLKKLQKCYLLFINKVLIKFINTLYYILIVNIKN